MGSTITQFLQMGKGLHCGAKTFSTCYLPLPQPTNRSNLKLFERGPRCSFWFLSGTFCIQWNEITTEQHLSWTGSSEVKSKTAKQFLTFSANLLIIQSYTQKQQHRQTQTKAYIDTQTHRHTDNQTHRHTHTQTHTHTHTHTTPHWQTHTSIHRGTRTHTNTHKHIVDFISGSPNNSIFQTCPLRELPLGVTCATKVKQK